MLEKFSVNILVDTTSSYQPVAHNQNYQPMPSTYNYSNDVQLTANNGYHQQWTQQPSTIPQQEHDTDSTQILNTNVSYYQPPTDQTSYIQPGFTSTPNPYGSSQQHPQHDQNIHHWQPVENIDNREIVSSNEVCDDFQLNFDKIQINDVVVRTKSFILLSEMIVPTSN